MPKDSDISPEPPSTPPCPEVPAHPARPCAECGKEFQASRNREHNLDLCKSCSDRQDTFYAICPPLYRFSDRERLPCGLDKLQQALAWQYGERGLLLHGPTGNGKTRVAWLLLRRLHFAGHGIIAFDAVSFSHEVARHFGPNGDGYGWARKIYTAPIVFLDDVGKCRLTERGEAELFGLVETRTANGKPIIATTNLVGDTLANAMRQDTGTPLARRLREFCECIAF